MHRIERHISDLAVVLANEPSGEGAMEGRSAGFSRSRQIDRLSDRIHCLLLEN